MTILWQNATNAKWSSKLKFVLIVFFLFFVPQALQAQKTLGLQLINNKSNTKYFFLTDEIINIRYLDNKRIKKIKGKLLILNDKEISVNSTVIRIDKIIKIKIKDQSVQSGVFRIIGGLAMIPPGVILPFYAIYVQEEGPAIIGLPLLGIGIYQLIEGYKILKSPSPKKIDQIVNRLTVVEIYPLVSQ